MQRRSLRYILRWLLAGITSSAVSMAPAEASNSAAGLISQIVVEQGRVFFSLNSARTATPACHIAGARWVINATTPAGQVMVSVLLSMQAQGKQVIVAGTGTCPDWGDTETVEYIMQAS